MGRSSDYHDYVFQDGRLVGNFEEMYRHSEQIPWRQDEQADWIDVRLTRELLRDLGGFRTICDLGCGTGHYLELIAQEFLLPGGTANGYDVSETACAKAARNFPNSNFSVFDLTSERPERLPFEPHEIDKRPRLFMIRGTIWYIFPKLITVIDNIARMMSGWDRLLVVQNFPPLEKAFVGKEIIPDHIALIRHFSSKFALERHVWYENQSRAVNDNWFIGIFRLKD